MARDTINDSPQAQTLHWYDNHVAAYTERTDALTPPGRDQITASVTPGTVILDVGCGPGRDLEHFHQLGGHPIGIDPSPAMIAAVHARLADPIAAGSAAAHVAAATNLPLVNRSVDAIWSCGALHHLDLDELTVAAAELHRVARPGATTVLTVKTTPDATNGRWHQDHDRSFYLTSPAAFAAPFTDAGFTITNLDVDADTAGRRQPWVRLTGHA